MDIKVCPRCKKPVEASDYMSVWLLGFGALDPKFTCKKCGFNGIPIVLSDDD